ncbi:D-tagatose-bisphosphate aldolase, class II, non-catalytic subunit [Rhizobium calliandrae]|uniref:D-tagatose-bisphosphate aldolase, class II, non-catalytic subunit n=1 Tax=Rhizobium calliandrae TaxID=1312182 RepID=A0ABT7KLX9_9HYPH|nr:D-tagatose-bisphosphate aldolase, class II, non-catalytic subunit [Rhizobium calliandrae]MDL2409649.1 D-tagatose-bisphosphate aldolase, class II, non-catalytic subunit [Rhizobium calliandrae]
MAQQNPLQDIAHWNAREAGFRGIPSICSAHPLVIQAAMLRALKTDAPLLIEATCNQVNQDGGYTGMRPCDFRRFVEEMAARTGFPTDRIILGGDHLGPNPWRSLDADEAMEKAEQMVRAYAAAGFTKLHLDTSMGCQGEPIALSDQLTATRAARLAAAAEDAVRGTDACRPVYVIGTEVPIPGGAMEELSILEVTKPDAAIRTVEIHAGAFEAASAGEAFNRVIGLVVQPGVEFGNHNVIDYVPENAEGLSASRGRIPGIVFEAHSTDYQSRQALRRLVADGYAILKVGPGLTFALREALYGLDQIATFLYPQARKQALQTVAEDLMLKQPKDWEKYYEGSAADQHLQRHFSYSDRIRYYWPHDQLTAAVDELLDLLGDAVIPETLISQHLARIYPRIRSGSVAPKAQAIVIAAIDLVLEDYFEACRS